jgi:GAF domain-containing protein
MIETFQRIEQGDLNQRVTVTTADEIGELGVHFNRMVERLSGLQGSLESEVKERTAQLRATVQVANAISAILSTDELIERVVNLIANEFDYYYVALFMIDSTGKWAELRAATGEAGRVLQANKHRLELNTKSMVGRSIALREPTVAMDTTDAPFRFENPLLPYTRSEIALPLIVGDRVLGALDAQSTREGEFGPDDIEALRTMANQVAVALENARLYQDTQRALQDMRALQRQYLLSSWKGFTEEKGTFDYAIGEIEPGENLSEMDIPLILRDQLIGEISVSSQREWTSEERSMIESIATQAALALENARLVEESRSAARREHLVAEITGKIWASTTVDAILQTAAREIGRAFETDEVSIELKASENE